MPTNQKRKPCTELFAHELTNLETVEITSTAIVKRCPKCGVTEELPKSGHSLLFVNNLVTQKKKWAHQTVAKEMLQPIRPDGSINEDFTEAYGFNPLDARTKSATPKIQGGSA